MESKRLGLCAKPLFAVPNHLTEQWASEFLRLYPSANILVASKKDFEPANRKKFCARIATGNYDAVIMGHSQFEKIPMSKERQERLLEEQIEEITEGIAELKESRAERFTIKELERTKKNLQVKLEKLQAEGKKDNVVTFEELGVDRLYVDEAHSFKNAFIYTKMRNVAGLSTTDSQKSADILMKCRYLDEITGNRGIVFATGTPIETGYLRLKMPILRCFYYLFLKLPWAAPVNLLKSLGEIAVVVKAAKAADGVYGVGGVLYHVRRISQAVIFQILKRGLTRYVPETPEHLAFTDECGGSHVIKSDLFGVMVVDKKQYVTEPCLLGNAGGRSRRHILFRQMDKYPEKLGKLVAYYKLVIGHSDIFSVPDVCEQPQYL